MEELAHKDIDKRIDKIESAIRESCLDEKYLAQLDRIEHDIDLALKFTAATAAVGLTSWVFKKFRRN